ncbi:MAG: tRNA pseudouridine(38-40) synthase TruA, partial [Pseudomonadota bacterium]
ATYKRAHLIVGCLRAVGEGRWSVADLESARDACDRTACASVAPAHGLYLVKVDYPDARPELSANTLATA